MISNIEEAIKCLNCVIDYRRNIVFMNEMILASNVCVDKLNKTYEANVFNFILSTLHARMVIELRKILEPSNRDKKNNVCSLIEFIKVNKEELLQRHFCDYLNMPVNFCDNQPAEIISEVLDQYMNERAKEASENCLKVIECILLRWDKIWKLLGKKEYKIRSVRDVIVHSMSPENVNMPSLFKIKKMLYITTYFIRKIDFIINNCSSHYEFEEDELRKVSEKFWSRFQ